MVLVFKEYRIDVPESDSIDASSAAQGRVAEKVVMAEAAAKFLGCAAMWVDFIVAIGLFDVAFGCVFGPEQPDHAMFASIMMLPWLSVNRVLCFQFVA